MLSQISPTERGKVLYDLTYMWSLSKETRMVVVSSELQKKQGVSQRIQTLSRKINYEAQIYSMVSIVILYCSCSLLREQITNVLTLYTHTQPTQMVIEVIGVLTRFKFKIFKIQVDRDRDRDRENGLQFTYQETDSKRKRDLINNCDSHPWSQVNPEPFLQLSRYSNVHASSFT